MVPEASAIKGPDARLAVAITGYFDEGFWRATRLLTARSLSSVPLFARCSALH
jgi:hypothetical protein